MDGPPQGPASRQARPPCVSQTPVVSFGRPEDAGSPGVVATSAGRRDRMRNLRTYIFAAAALVGAITGASAQDAKPIPLKVGTLKQGSLTNVWVAQQAGI